LSLDFGAQQGIGGAQFQNSLCFQHLERYRDQRFSKPNLRATIVYGVIGDRAFTV
jgi:hypothetical protein